MLDNEAPERIFDASEVSKDCQKIILPWMGYKNSCQI